MPKYIVTAVVPFSVVVEANTAEHARNKAEIHLEENSILIARLEEPNKVIITDVKEMETEDDN